MILGALGVLTCGGEDNKEPVPLETQQAALTATDNIENTLLDLADTIKFLEDSKLLKSSAGFFWGSESTSMVCEPVPVGEPDDPWGEPNCYEVNEEEEFELDLQEGLDELAQEVVGWLHEHVFVDSQVETDDGKTIVYLLDPEVVCMDEDTNRPDNMKVPPDDMGTDEAPGDFGGGDEWEDEWDEDDGTEECKDFFTKLPVRVKLVSYKAGDLDVDILFGESQIDPLHLQLHADMLAMEIDLAKTKTVVEMALDVLGEEDDAFMPEVFAGEFRWELKKLDDNRVKFSYEVKKALQVVVKEGADTFSLTLDKSSASVTANKLEESLTWALNTGALTAAFPYQLFIDGMWGDDEEEWGDDEWDDTPPMKDPPDRPADDMYGEEEWKETPQVTGTMTLHLAGLTGEMTMTADDETATFKGLGLGKSASYLKRNDTSIFSVKLNEKNGWDFDLTFSLDGDDVLVKVKPLLDLVVMGNLQAIADDLSEVPEFMLDETLQLLLDGASEPTVKFLDGGEDGESAIQVAAGKLTLSSTAAPADTVVVNTGQCLVGEDDEATIDGGGDGSYDEEAEEEDDGHLLASLHGDACP